MCRKFILASSQETIENRFNLSPNHKLEWEPKYIVSPGEETLIITQQNHKELTLSSFGMTPSWAKQPMNLINARAEGNKNPKNDPMYTGSHAIFMKPAFKKPLHLPLSKDIELPGPFTRDTLKPAGERIYTEVEQKFIPQRHYGHKQKGAGSGTWRGNAG